jgi:copper(I)-binding protein
VELKPGGFHMMLMGLTRPLKTGDKVQLTLNFEKAGKIPVTAEVKEQ